MNFDLGSDAELIARVVVALERLPIGEDRRLRPLNLQFIAQRMCSSADWGHLYEERQAKIRARGRHVGGMWTKPYRGKPPKLRAKEVTRDAAWTFHALTRLPFGKQFECFLAEIYSIFGVDAKPAGQIKLLKKNWKPDDEPEFPPEP